MKELKDYLYYHEDGPPSIDIYCGDCLEIMPLLPKVDLVVTDPPYGIDIASNPFRQKHEKADWDEKPCSKERLDMMKAVSANQIIWGGNYFEGLFPSQGFLIWDKGQPEDFSSAMCELAWTSRNRPAKMFKKWVVSFEKFHPTTKPIVLMKWSIQQEDFWNIALSILDPFLGSGTTLVACKELKRNGIGIEINEKYCEIAKKRLMNTQVPML